MHKFVFYILGVASGLGVYYFPSRTTNNAPLEQDAITQDALLPMESVAEDMDGDILQFDLNADSLDQYLAAENPFYSGGFVPVLNDIGVLTPASEFVLGQFVRFEFLDEQAFRNDGGRSPILEYARGSIVEKAAADVTGFYEGLITLGTHQGHVWMSFVPVGKEGLVYDAQWSFAAKTVRRFRRIPEQARWLNTYLPTAWVKDDIIRVEIPRGAIFNAGLNSLPQVSGIDLDELVAFEMRGRWMADGLIEGELFAIGVSEEIGELKKHAATIGTFSLRKSPGNND